MKQFKRVMAILLSLVMLIGSVPGATFAEETESTAVDNGELTVEGTNGVGALLSDEISAYQEAEAEEDTSGYNVIGLTIENGVATAEFRTLETATLIVALYTEDGLQMLLSGSAEVQPEDTTVQIPLEGEIPSYFMASAYLVDNYDYSPLCSAYDTPMYTQEMQELLNSTVADYDADRVLQLDEDETTNFAVYEEDTIIIEAQEGVNTVTSVDDETATYVIENADESITSLCMGDVFAYPYGENEVLLVKVASVTVEGTTATVTGMELSMEDVFSYVKIEDTGSTTDMTVDESIADEGVTYEGDVPADEVATFGLSAEDTVTEKIAKRFSLDKTLKSNNASVTFSGYLDMSFDFVLSYYISFEKQHLEFKVNTTFDLRTTISGAASADILLAKLNFSPKSLKGLLFVGFKPTLNVSFSGKMDYQAKLTSTIGFAYDFGGGFKSLNTTPRLVSNYEISGSVYFGIDLAPELTLDSSLDKAKSIKLVSATFTAKIGLRLNAVQSGTLVDTGDDRGEVVHDCKSCLSITATGVLEFNAALKFLESDWEWLNPKTAFAPVSKKLKTLYWSKDYDDLGEGGCPHLSYRITIQSKRADESVLTGVPFLGTNNENWGTTNKNGVLIKYLPAGTYTVTAVWSGEKTSKTISVSSPGRLTFIVGKKQTSKAPGALGTVNSEKLTDRSAVVIASGNCGPLENGVASSSVTWQLNAGGTLYISGTGPMADYYKADQDENLSLYRPWAKMRKSIKRVVIGEGVTTIGNIAFVLCENIESVVIPSSMVSIGTSAFNQCKSMKTITIPSSVQSIGGYAFYNCDSLTKVTIPNGVESIEAGVFRECSNLRSVTIGTGVAHIKRYAFGGCTNLKTVTFQGDAPNVKAGFDPFMSAKATIYYPEGNTTWTDDVKKDIASQATITWVPYSGVMTVDEVTLPTLYAVWGGEYGTETYEDYTLKTASFSGLVPGEQYQLLSLVSIDTETPLSADNVLYVDQGTAEEDGTLVFRYIQREDTEVTYVMACGASGKTLDNAQITFPELFSTAYEKAPAPVVVYDGETLVEGEDYVVVGAADFTETGDYTCYIRGIRDYSGLRECTYTVAPINTGSSQLKLAVSSVYEDGFRCRVSKALLETYGYTDPYLVAEYNGSTVSQSAYTDSGKYYVFSLDGITGEGLVNVTLYATYEEAQYTSQPVEFDLSAYTAATVASDSGTEYFVDVESAIRVSKDDDSSHAMLKENITADVTIDQSGCLDLNGYDITGVVTVAEGCTLYCMDTQTDDYTVADGNYGKLGDVQGSVAAYSVDGAVYMSVTEADGTSFHRVGMDIYSMTLRASQAGVYYNSTFKADEVAAQRVAQFGVALSVVAEPTAENLKKNCQRSVFTDFAAAQERYTGTLLRWVMKSENLVSENRSNAEMPVYGRAYILTTDGQYLFGQTVSRSFRQQVEGVDALWDTLTDVQKEEVRGLYMENLFIMKNWDVPNIREAFGTDNGDVSFDDLLQ